MANEPTWYLFMVSRSCEILGAVDVEELGPYPDHEKLSDFFFERELAQRLLRPLFAAVVEIDRAGVLVFFFGEAGQADGQQQQ